MQSKALYEEIFPKLPRSGSVLKRELKKSRKKKWWRGQRLKSKFKEFDIYGEQIGLTYKGESSFKTTPGAIVSCIVQLLMIAFTIYRLIIFVNKDDPSVSKQSFLRNLDGEDPLHPNEYGFNLAFGLGVPMDRSIGYYTANLVTFNYEFKEDGTRERKKYKKSMPLDYCGNSSFQGLNASQVSMYGIPGFQCINQSSLYLSGDFYSEQFTYAEFRVYKCQNSSKSAIECQDQDVIDNFFMTQTLSIAMINSYFDFSDYTRRDLSHEENIDSVGVIKQYIDDRFFLELDPTRSKKAKIFLMKSEADLQDDYIQLGQSDGIKFVEIYNKHVYESQYTNSGGYLVSFYLRYDSQYNSYNRQVYSIMAFLGDVGGLYSSLFSIGALFISFINHRLFISAILKNLYQVKSFNTDGNLPIIHKEEDDIEKDYRKRDTFLKRTTTAKAKRVKIKSLDISEEIATNRGIDQTIDVTRNQSEFNEVTIADKIPQQKPLEQVIKDREMIFLGSSTIQKILMNIVNRKRFSYTGKDIVTFLLRCLCVRKSKQKVWKGTKEEWDEVMRKHYHYKEGEDKLFDELDVITLLKSMRRVKLLTQTLLTQSQKMVLKFQRKNLIESNSSSGDSDTNNKFETVSLMESNDPLMRLVVYSKIKHMITQFSNTRLHDTDRRLLRGLFVKHIKDFDEEYKEKMKKKPLIDRLMASLKRIQNSEHSDHEASMLSSNEEQVVEDQSQFESVGRRRNQGNHHSEYLRGGEQHIPQDDSFVEDQDSSYHALQSGGRILMSQALPNRGLGPVIPPQVPSINFNTIEMDKNGNNGSLTQRVKPHESDRGPDTFSSRYHLAEIKSGRLKKVREQTEDKPIPDNYQEKQKQILFGPSRVRHEQRPTIKINKRAFMDEEDA